MRFLAAFVVLPVLCLAQVPAKRKVPAKQPAKATVKQALDYSAWPLVSLKITGNRLYGADQVIAATGLKIGHPVAKADFDAARAKLLATGAFESVGSQFGPSSDGQGYTGSFEVVEVAQLYPFRFEGLPAPDDQLKAYLRLREPLFQDRIPGTKERIDRFAADLQTFLGDKFQDKVIGQMVSERPGELAVLFRSASGPPVIAEVEFTGSEVVPGSTLQSKLSEVAIGTPYRDAALRQLLDTSIRPVYDGRGRLKVSFPKIEARKAKDVDGVRVKIQVDEGPVYKFGAIESAVPVVPPKKVLKMATFKTGDVANFDAVIKVIDAVQAELRKEGYMRSTTEVQRVMHDRDKTVDIQFTSNLGTRFLMGKLDVKGLDVVSEPAIRKLWVMKPGDPYNADYPQFFLDRVKADGYFDNLLNTRWDQSINEKTDTVDVTLYFKGGNDDTEKEKRRKREMENPQIQGPDLD